MKASLKKSILLLGVAAGFVLKAWAVNNDPAWFAKTGDPFYCQNGGTFVELRSEPDKVYGYCICVSGYIGQRCEWKLEE